MLSVPMHMHMLSGLHDAPMNFWSNYASWHRCIVACLVRTNNLILLIKLISFGAGACHASGIGMYMYGRVLKVCDSQ